jgi:hypothetical protein
MGKGLDNVSKEGGKALIGKTDQEKHEANVERDLDNSKTDYERLQKEKQYERKHRDGYDKP